MIQLQKSKYTFFKQKVFITAAFKIPPMSSANGTFLLRASKVNVNPTKVGKVANNSLHGANSD